MKSTKKEETRVSVLPDGDSESVKKSVLMLKTGQLNDIETLHEGFDLQRMPQNYLNNRSYIEKIIFHASMSDVAKSPFSGVNQSPLGLRLADAPHGSMRKSLPAPSVSRELSPTRAITPAFSTLDSPHRSPSPLEQTSLVESPPMYSDCPQSVDRRTRTDASPQRAWIVNPDEYLHLAKWQLKDLSFLVGSDLAIFGTRNHPCISLKLSPIHQSINVFTGVDIWLENLLNEVPEVAMCYHHEGIVMQEYQIYKTCDLPTLTGFETQEVYSTVRNLIMFLKRNATQEGHTYWLVREPGLDVVKLYDLTQLCDRDGFEENDVKPETVETDVNPFIFPVATLCYRLAERRWTEYRARLNSNQKQDSTDEALINETDSLTDALRLLRNCLNLINMVESVGDRDLATGPNSTTPTTLVGLMDLKTRAVLLLCQLYLVSPGRLMNNCIRLLQTLPDHGPEVSTMRLDMLNGSAAESSKHTDQSTAAEDADRILSVCLPSEGTDRPTERDARERTRNRRLLGNVLIEAFKSSDTVKLSQLAIKVIESCSSAMPIAPSSVHPLQDSTVRDKDSVQRTLSRLRASTPGSEQPTWLMSVTLLKAYLGKACDFWNRNLQQLTVHPITMAPIHSLRMVLRHVVPCLLLLEHSVPDHHTGSSLESENPREQAVCPHCGSTGLESTPAGVSCSLQTRMLWQVSCIFAAYILYYSDVVTMLREENHWKPPERILPNDTDGFLMQSACTQAAQQLQVLWDNALRGPLPNPPTMDSDSTKNLQHSLTWLDTIWIAIRCLHRVLSSRLPTVASSNLLEASKSVQHRTKHTGGSKGTSSSRKPGHTISPTKGKAAATDAILMDAPPFHGLASEGPSGILPDWWPRLVNIFIVTLRMTWMSVSGSPKLDGSIDRAMRMLHTSPIPMDQLGPKWHSVTMANELQLYKLAAAVASDSPPETLSWTKQLNHLPPSIRPSLPLCTLIYTRPIPQTNKHTGADSTDSTSTAAAAAALTESTGEGSEYSFSLTAVCLARAMDTVLRYLVSTGGVSEGLPTQVQQEMNLSLLIACNEFIATCIPGSIKSMSSAPLSTILSVTKIALRYSPDNVPVTRNNNSNSNKPIDPTTKVEGVLYKSTLIQLIRLRIYQLRMAFHFYGLNSDGSAVQLPSWTTLVAQTRSVLTRYWLHVAPMFSVRKPDLSNDSIGEWMELLGTTISFVSMQVENASVLAISGLLVVLKDLALTNPVVQLFSKHLQRVKDNATDGDAVFAVGFRQILHTLFILCSFVIDKLDRPSRQQQLQPQQEKHRRKAGSKPRRKPHTSESEPLNMLALEMAKKILEMPAEWAESFSPHPDQFYANLRAREIGTAQDFCQLLTPKLACLVEFCTHI